MNSQEESAFCPHLNYRVAFQYGQIRTSSISVSDGHETSCGYQSNTDAECGSEETKSAKPFKGVGDGVETCRSDSPMEVDQVNSKKIDRSETTESPKQAAKPVCDMCDPSVTTKNDGQWRCLDPRCGLILCGTAFKNHSQSHFEESPHHMLQQSLSTKRIWCNECQHEVLPKWNNRRMAPAVWVPPDWTEEEGPKGLYNIGNTCFMNAALQCMISVTPLNSYFLGYSCLFPAGKQVAMSYLWLLTEMWNEQDGGAGKGIMPSRLLHSIRISHPMFRGRQQHDTQEFLRLFMDTLTEESKIPHWRIEEKKPEKKEEASDEGSDSEADSFETCDSGTGSEEMVSVQNCDINGMNKDSDTSADSGIVVLDLKSIVSDIFDGKLESSVQCLSCKQFSRRIEVFQDLSLPIPTRDEMIALRAAEKLLSEEHRSGWATWFWDWFRSFFIGPVPTLEDCFAAFFSSDELKGKNMYSCEKCKKLRNGLKRCSLYQLPEVLCVHLKRFRLVDYGGGMGFSGKISQYVQFPMEGLDLKPFTHPECTSTVTTYRLQSIIVQLGSLNGGHYIAYVRRGDLWFVCDDSRVVQVNPETVTESEAYVLFYQKYDEKEDLTKQVMLQEWAARDNDPIPAEKFHLLSRKWLTMFCWGEESGPIDNSDVVCPHGYIAPSDSVHLAATWVPDSVWKILHDRYGGGPDLVHHSECLTCTQAWKKKQKSLQKSKSNSFDSSTTTIYGTAPNIPLLITANSSSHFSSSLSNNVNDDRYSD